jgi:hypothetical protein
MCKYLQKFTQFIKNLFGRRFFMKEIILVHNGIEYTKEYIIKMLDLVFEIVGEEV